MKQAEPGAKIQRKTPRIAVNAALIGALARSGARAPPRFWRYAPEAPVCAWSWLRLMESLFSAET